MAQKQSPVAKTIDYTGLTNEVSKADIKLFLDAQGLTGKLRITKTVTMIAGGIAIIFVVPNFFLGAQQAIGSLIFILFAAGIVALILVAAQYGYKKSVRLWRFAVANAFQYAHTILTPSYNGMIFQQGYSRFASNVVYVPGSDTLAAFEMGDYQYTTGSGKNRQTHLWSYISIEMDRQLPHMVLDSRSNNLKIFGKDIASNLPESFSKDQILSLEGDFNNSFTLYAPKEYERDALYIFTPDLMALLMDQSAQFDAEIIDNRVFFYRRLAVDRTNPTIMYQLLTIINTVGMKMYRQTDYYADERVGDRANNVVAQSGRRLKRGVNWFVVIVIIIIFAVWIVPNFVRH